MNLEELKEKIRNKYIDLSGDDLNLLLDQGPKDKEGKLDWSVFPFSEAEAVVRVFESGAKKYGAPFTYRKGVPIPDLIAAAVRHLVCIQNEKYIDEESGCYHAAHVAANALMILSHYLKP